MLVEMWCSLVDVRRLVCVLLFFGACCCLLFVVGCLLHGDIGLLRVCVRFVTCVCAARCLQFVVRCSLCAARCALFDVCFFFVGC